MHRFALAVLVFCLTLTACGGKATPAPEEVARLVAEGVRGTAEALSTEVAQALEVTPTTQLPTVTPTAQVPTATPTPDELVYVKDRHGIEIRFPRDWEPDIEGTEGTVLAIRKIVRTSEGERVQAASFQVMDTGSTDLPLYEEVIRRLASGDRTIVEAFGPRAIGGQMGVAAVVSVHEDDPASGSEVFQIMAAVKHPQTELVYVFMGSAMAEVWAEAEPVFWAILGGMEFFAPGTPREGEVSKVVQLLDWAIYPTSTGRDIVIDGEIKNVSHETIRRVKVHVKLLDSRGGLLRVASAYAEPDELPPGGTALFSITAENPPGLATVQFSQYTWE
ncbi:MAG: hypothetical protein H8E35_16450 [Ardenticatenia bacterium]|nr:hypothetical protein [Ardenticatenia bacterium]